MEVVLWSIPSARYQADCNQSAPAIDPKQMAPGTPNPQPKKHRSWRVIVIVVNLVVGIVFWLARAELEVWWVALCFLGINSYLLLRTPRVRAFLLRKHLMSDPVTRISFEDSVSARRQRIQDPNRSQLEPLFTGQAVLILFVTLSIIGVVIHADVDKVPQTQLSQLEIGNCIRTFNTETERHTDSLPVVNCAEPHDGRLIYKTPSQRSTPPSALFDDGLCYLSNRYPRARPVLVLPADDSWPSIKVSYCFAMSEHR